MHKSYEFEDSYYLRSGKRYKVECKNCFGHHHSNSSEAIPNSPSNNRNESGLMPPTPQKLLVNPFVGSQTPLRGQGPPPP